MSNSGSREKRPDSKSKTDSARCAICQGIKNESLRCRADSKRQSDVGARYKTLVASIIKFSELDSMPIDIDLSRLDEGDGLENTFL